MLRNNKSIGSHDESGDSSEEEQVCKRLIPLKLKHKNRVKKIADLPKEFKQLDSIVRKKYDEFKQGKETYTMCYLDDENELINISDDDDYEVYKDYVNTNSDNTAKVFLTVKGEEDKFNPDIDDAQTVNESVIFDDELQRLQMMRSSIDSPFMSKPKALTDGLFKELMSKIDKLTKKDEKKAAKKALKQQKKLLAKQKKEAKKKEKAEKKAAKLKEKEVKLDEPLATERIIEAKLEKVKLVESDAKSEKSANEKPDHSPFIVEASKPEPLAKVNVSISSNEKVKEAAAADDEEAKHEYAIQPAFKRKDKKALQKPKDTLCAQCKNSLEGRIKYVSSINTDFYLCELCEIKSDHEHVFIKLKHGVDFDAKAYDEFCQKMIGIFAPAARFEAEREVQEAIMNDEKDEKPIKILPLMAKRAQIMNKDEYKNGMIATRGKPFEIEWEVKNFTNREWSHDVIIVCLPSSDIIVNEQKVDLRLGGGKKGKVSMKFIVPRNTNNKEILGLDLCLFDRVENKFIGDELKINLALIS